MINKLFLDTNIVADLIDTSRQNHIIALNLVKYCILNDIIIAISEDMLNTLFYISKDKNKTLEFIENVILVDWEVLSYGKDTIKKAIKIAKEKNLDLEDLLQCLCAKNNNCDAFITNDKKFYNCEIKIISSKDFLK